MARFAALDIPDYDQTIIQHAKTHDTSFTIIEPIVFYLEHICCKHLRGIGEIKPSVSQGGSALGGVEGYVHKTYRNNNKSGRQGFL